MYNFPRTKHKKVITVFICLFICIIVLSHFININALNKGRIVRLVNNNQDYLNKCIINKTYDKILKIKGIKNITPYSLSDNKLFIDFFCNGFGLAPSSIYYGFYYSSSDEPVGFQATKVKLKPKGDGWEWKEPNGDNYYYTEKISKNWYYYKAGF